MPSSVLNIEPEHITATLSSRQSLSGTLNTKSCQLTAVVSRDSSMPQYTGEYEAVSRYQEDYVLETAGYAMTQNVVIKRIPKNYGLISWNGAVLTVS